MDLDAKIHFDNLFVANPKPCGNLLIYQLGEMLCNRNTVIPTHKQYCFEFSYVLDGKGIIYTDDIAYPAKKNQLFWSYPNETHRIVSDNNDPLHFCYAAYNCLNDPPLEQIHLALTGDPPVVRKILDAPFVRSTFLNLINEAAVNDFLSPQAIEAQLKYLIFSAFRLIHNRDTSKYTVDRSDIPLLVYRITKYMEDNVFTIKHLFDLEAVFNYDYKYLSRCFQKIMGETLNRYFLSKKMNTALELLSQGPLSVTQISEKLNYSCVQAFTRAFTAYFGHSPCNITL